jgi:dienelactone hydrolase
MGTDDLSDFTRSSETFEGKARDVFRRGSGPAVIVISEIPGITPAVAAFARRVSELGLTAVMPHLFGEPGREPTGPYAMSTFAWACVSREFAAFATGRTSPVTSWLRALARAERDRCGGPGVGAVGMCFTGGFALAMMVDDAVVAPVLSQPSLPLPISASRKHDVGVSPDDLTRARQHAHAADLCLLGLRFTGDSFVPTERFERLRQEFGDRFVAVEIDSSPGNPYGNPRRAHSVLTEHLVDQPGHPTRAALDQVLDFFRTRLLGV